MTSTEYHILMTIINPHIIYPIFLAILALFLAFNIGLIIFHFLPSPSFLLTHPKLRYRCLAYLRHHRLALELFFSIVAILLLTALLLPTPRVTFPRSPAFGILNVDNTHPLVVEFDRPINFEALQITIAPPAKGHWQAESGSYYAIFHNRLLFYPDQTLPADTVFSVTMLHISSLTKALPSTDYLFSFHTPPPPKVVSINPKDGQVDVEANQTITVALDTPDASRASWNFTLSPDTPVNISTPDLGKTYSVKPTDPLRKGIVYTLTGYRASIVYDFSTNKVISHDESLKMFSSSFTTIASPNVKSASPTGSGILITTLIKVEFRQDMDQASVAKSWSISPSVSGGFKWDGLRLVTFTPSSPLQKNTHYRVTIAKTVQTAEKIQFDNDYSFEFTTIGYVQASGFNPGSGAKNVNLNQSVNVSFNQAVDHPSAESKFSISPNVNGHLTWNGNTLIFSHDNFAYATSYSVNIASGIKTVNGLDSNQAFSSTFTTKSQSVTLNIPSYHQAHMYSCFATAAREALAYRGVNVSEDAISNRIGYDPTPWSGTWNEPGSVWGDPDSAIVGSLDGKANNIGWGYGAHWGPTARAISSFGRSAEVKSGWTVQGVAQAIAAGNPVIVWWVNGVWPAYNVTWTNNGRTIHAVNSLHVQVVKGFTGSVDNPTAFIINDSGYGYPGRTIDTASFLAKWRWFNNSAVVVY